MKNVFLISLNTFKEIWRHKMLSALGVVAVFLIGAGFILGSLSLNEQKRLSINFVFTACHIGLIFISVYFASFLLAYEIEKKTILTLFVKPISRVEFILGKFLGLSFVLMVVVIFLTVFVLGVYFIYGHTINNILFIAMWGVFLEAVILLAGCFLLSNFTSSFVVLIYTTLIFIIGHSMGGIHFFLKELKETSFLYFTLLIGTNVFPNLQTLNWRTHALYQDPLKEGELFFTSLYSISWIMLLLAITCILFKRRSIV